jgi:ribonuclease HI
MTKQLSLYDLDPVAKPKAEWHLYVDGASRCNPGLSGGGFCILKSGMQVSKKGFFLGHKTNNEAEYYALLLGLDYLMNHTDFQSKSDHVKIFADSLLLVRQISGHYRVKSPHLIKLFEVATALVKSLNYSIVHVLREKNTVADKAANDGIDGRHHPLLSFVTLCKRYGISL